MQIPTNNLYPSHAGTVPIVTGGHGLTGRPQVRPAYDLEEIADPDPGGLSLPTGCLRNLQLARLNRPVDDLCSLACAGRQKDGSCLADLVRAVPEGDEWTCDIRVDQYGNQFWRLIIER